MGAAGHALSIHSEYLHLVRCRYPGRVPGPDALGPGVLSHSAERWAPEGVGLRPGRGAHLAPSESGRSQQRLFEDAPAWGPAAAPPSARLVPCRVSPKVDLKLKNPDFWASLHGQVPGLLDWDMGNEIFLAFTTDHLPPAQQNLARYKLQIVEPPKLTLNKGANSRNDDSSHKPNLWLWVNPNIVYPAGKLAAPEPVKGEQLTSLLPSPQLPLKDEDLDSCSEVTVESPSPSSSEKSPPRKRIASSPILWALTEEEAEAEDQDDSSSVALLSPHKRAPLQSRRLRYNFSQEGPLWARPPLNYFHLIALALRNSAPCGLNVQQIYSFTRLHFPFFRTAPEGWKNTIRHNLCFRDSFEKVPVGPEDGANPRPRCCLWKLTEKGHARFLEEVRTLAATQLQSIRKCMSQPDVMPFLFDL